MAKRQKDTLFKTLTSETWATSPTILEGSVAECTACQIRYPATPGSSPALATCWICSRSFQVQILLHVSKIANWLLPASWGFLILLCSTHSMLCFLLFEWSACKLYLLYLVLYTHFINSIICIYAIHPSGCNVLVLKLCIYLCIYLSIYLNLRSALSTINKTLTFNLVSVQCFFIHCKGGWRLSDRLSPIYRVLGLLLPVCFI